MIGGTEVLVIGGAVLILFAGPWLARRLARGAGETIRAVREAVRDIQGGDDA